MEGQRMVEVADNSLQKARRYATQANWPRAFAHYLTLLEQYSAAGQQIEDEFEQVMLRLGEFLKSTDRYDDLLLSYNKGLQHFPSNVKILNEMGFCMLYLEEPEVAVQYFQRAYLRDTNNLSAAKNFDAVKLAIIPRWHFRMLNDYKRNDAYRMAISNAVNPQYNKVLDIGAGCGLLSFYASKCKDVESIITVEASKTLSKMATDALREVEIVTVINKHSLELSSAEIGLSNLLVTAIFDCGLFGRHVLKTLIHAWDNLLQPTAKVVPHSANLFVTGINSELILSRNNFFIKIPQLKLDSVCVRSYNGALYEAENLKEKNVKFMTNTRKIVSINFNDIQQLKEIDTRADVIPPCTLKCVQSGTLHAFAIWFDLHLDENIVITTNPLKDNVKCWEQAVVHLDHPLTVQEGEEITLQLSCVNDRLEIKILDQPSTCPQCFKVSSEMITFLNDVQVVEAAEDLELPNTFNQRYCQILDLNPVPLFALFRAKKGFPGNYQCLAMNCDRHFLDFLWRSNGFQSFDEANNGAMVTFQIRDWLEVKNLMKSSLDVIFINPVSKYGVLCEGSFENIANLSPALKCDGLILPKELTLHIELIDSKYLDFCHKVEEENLHGFKVADAMNRYSIFQQLKVKPQYYPRKTLCNLITNYNILANGVPSSSVDYEVTLPIPGNANGVLYWYTMEFSENVCINTYKSVHYHGACFVFHQPRLVESGNTLTINICQDKGLLAIGCDEEDDYEDEVND